MGSPHVFYGRPHEESILLSSTLLCVCHGYSKLSDTISDITRVNYLPVKSLKLREISAD